MKRIGHYIFTLIISWYAMMGIHEFGHCLGCWLTGGVLTGVEFPLIGFSRTVLAINPHPLIVTWFGPIIGVLVPNILLLIPSANHMLRKMFLFFCGFCWITNGLYIGGGSFGRVGDCQELMANGAQQWQLIVFGVAALGIGLWQWHLATKSVNKPSNPT